MSTTRRIRSNAGQIILTGGRGAVNRSDHANHSTLLDVARDCYSGDLADWAYELLWTTQILRMAYDSPRIGGGIDPNVATNVASWSRPN